MIRVIIWIIFDYVPLSGGGDPGSEFYLGVRGEEAYAVSVVL